MNPTDASRRAAPARLFFLALLGVLLVYAGSATHLIDLPGVYMDAVNPDYLVAKVLNRAHADPLVAWVLPGNYLANRFPVLVSLYHGLQQFWLALPLYAIFGMSVDGIRLTHMIFAMGVLVAVLLLLRRAQVPLWIAALAGIALAADPTFVFAFRTQSYITMSPMAWLLLSLAALSGPASAATPLPFATTSRAALFRLCRARLFRLRVLSARNAAVDARDGASATNRSLYGRGLKDAARVACGRGRRMRLLRSGLFARGPRSRRRPRAGSSLISASRRRDWARFRRGFRSSIASAQPTSFVESSSPTTGNAR